jgi:tungstate transport system ATP-binding protein
VVARERRPICQIMSLYQLRAVTRKYGERRVVDVDALDIERGEILGLVGPSGSGKSTLLRLLNFLEPPTSGTILFDGQPIPAELPLALLRRVTTVFQRPILFSRSVRENVAYGLRLRGLSLDGRVDETLERVGLTPFAHHLASKLSGGELQRAALARALVLDPEVLLLDEPTANLDPYNVGLIESIVREQNQERGTTVVLVTHNVFQARRLASRVGLLLEGKIVEVAPVEQFFEAPRDARTAAFVRGEMVY